MATRFELETEIVIPNITIERQYINDVHTGYRLTPNEGYVLHSPSRDVEVEDPMTGETHIEQYYYRMCSIPKAKPVSAWDWHAVLESSVPPDMIFGGGNNDHEVM